MRKIPEKLYVQPQRQDARRTKSAGGDYIDKLQAYRDQHVHSLFSSLGRLVAAPFTSLLTVLVLAVAIALAAGFYMTVTNLQHLLAKIDMSGQISLYLKDTINEAEANDFADNIMQNPFVEQVKIITQDEALKEFKTYSGFGSAIDLLETNPLPVVIEVTPKEALEDKQKLEALLESLKNSPKVDVAQFDMLWLERFQSLLTIAKQGGTLLGGLIGIGVILIIGNTIRLELHNRRDEVIIAKLVGATDTFIQRPFLYAGFWLGFLSGVAGWFIVTGIMLILWHSIEKFSRLYGGSFHLFFLTFSETLALILISSALGIFGSWGVLLYQLRYTKPD